MATIPTWGASIHEPDDLRWTARHWAARIGVKVAQIHLRDMRSKWASISTTGRLTLNRDLLDLPADLIEYVVVHELVHLLAPNHGKLFKSFLLAYLPDWQSRADRLRAYPPLPGVEALPVHPSPSLSAPSGGK